MKNKVVTLSALLLVICLLLSSCGGEKPAVETSESVPADNAAGEPADTAGTNTLDEYKAPSSVIEEEESGSLITETQAPAGNTQTDGATPGRIGTGKYTYEVAGVELELTTRIEDYVDGQYFLLYEYLLDAGWKPWPLNEEGEDPNDPLVSSYYRQMDTLWMHDANGKIAFIRFEANYGAIDRFYFGTLKDTSKFMNEDQYYTFNMRLSSRETFSTNVNDLPSDKMLFVNHKGEWENYGRIWYDTLVVGIYVMENYIKDADITPLSETFHSFDQDYVYNF